MPKINKFFTGWAGERLAREQFDLFSHLFEEPRIVGGDDTTTTKRFLYWYVRKVLNGKDAPLYAQEIGDCTSHGTKNSLEKVQAVQMVVNNLEGKWRPIYPPYIYGCERVFIGKRQLGNQDGGLGVWCAQSIEQYGVLAADEDGVQPYSGQIAKSWGYSGPPDKFVQLGKQHLVKKTAPVKNFDQLCDAIIHLGAAVNVCSNTGFEMMPRSDGFHYKGREPWSHSMSFIGVDKTKEYALLENNWGDVHGHLKDFDTDEMIPPGILRIKAQYVDEMLGMGDSYLYNGFDSWQSQADLLDSSLFDIIGD